MQTTSADWEQVLARVEKALLQAVARLQEREQALAATPTAAPTPKALNFAKFDKRLSAFANRPQQAEQQLQELDLALREGENAMRQWLNRAETARRQLAEWLGRAVR